MTEFQPGDVVRMRCAPYVEMVVVSAANEGYEEGFKWECVYATCWDDGIRTVKVPVVSVEKVAKIPNEKQPDVCAEGGPSVDTGPVTGFIRGGEEVDERR